MALSGWLREAHQPASLRRSAPATPGTRFVSPQPSSTQGVLSRIKPAGLTPESDGTENMQLFTRVPAASTELVRWERLSVCLPSPSPSRQETKTLITEYDKRRDGSDKGSLFMLPLLHFFFCLLCHRQRQCCSCLYFTSSLIYISSSSPS